MYQDNITLCGASAYEKKFYFNQDFNALPDHVKKELQESLEMYYKVFFLGDISEEELKKTSGSED